MLVLSAAVLVLVIALSWAKNDVKRSIRLRARSPACGLSTSTNPVAVNHLTGEAGTLPTKSLPKLDALLRVAADEGAGTGR